MNLDNNILRLITRYLDRKETNEERQTLYNWYDEQAEGKTVGQRKINQLQKRTRARLAAEIDGMEVRHAIVTPLWYRVAAAAVVLLVFYFSFLLYQNAHQPVQVQSAELAHILPVADKVIITLSTGKMVDPDSLGKGQSVQIGNAIVQKDSSGQLTYKASADLSVPNVTSTVQTPRATQYSIELADGTKVFLNAKSKLSFPDQFGNGDRIVKLSGEAYFEVTKTLTHSKFIVQTDRESIQVLGTKFNVNAYEDVAIVKTTLAEGSVRVTPQNKSLKPLLIKPNQQAVLTNSDIASIEVDAQQIIAWKDGFFVFDGNNTEEVIREIGEWYGIPVENNIGNRSVKYAGKIPKNINMARLVMLLSYADINLKVLKDHDNKLRIIVN